MHLLRPPHSPGALRLANLLATALLAAPAQAADMPATAVRTRRAAGTT